MTTFALTVTLFALGGTLLVAAIAMAIWERFFSRKARYGRKDDKGTKE